jgi:hypothetical protein
MWRGLLSERCSWGMDQDTSGRGPERAGSAPPGRAVHVLGPEGMGPRRARNCSRSLIQPPSSETVASVRPWPPGSRRA